MEKATNKQLGYISYLVRINPTYRAVLPVRIREDKKVDYTLLDFNKKCEVKDQIAVGDMIRILLDTVIPENNRIESLKDFIK